MTPTLIPFPKKAEEFSGLDADTLRRINRSEYPGIVRKRGEGNGTRYYLHTPTWLAYAARLRSAE
jgi:hypothetical protein